MRGSISDYLDPTQHILHDGRFGNTEYVDVQILSTTEIRQKDYRCVEDEGREKL